MFVKADAPAPEASLQTLPPALADRLAIAQCVFRAKTQAQLSHAAARLADRDIGLECDDRSLFPDFFSMFGGSAPQDGALPQDADLRVRVLVHAHPEYGWFQIAGRDRLPVDAREFTFALDSGRGIFTRLADMPPGWTGLAFRDTGVLAFAFRDRECLFSKHPSWRESIMWYLFWRLLRLRNDTIFFHASTVGIAGNGVMFVGSAGAGKSTTALALAALGHDFLGDEVAAYRPDSGNLAPFRRPIGIKRGPRCTAIERALGPAMRERIALQGFARIAVEDLLAVPPPRELPLRHVVFLDRFRESPGLQEITPGQAEIARLQPLLSSFLNESHSRRIFQLTRLLGTVRCHRLFPGDPDATARYLQHRLAPAVQD